MRASLAIVLACGLVGTWAAPAAAVLIDFEDLPADPFSLYEESGVVFTAVGGGNLQRFPDTPNGTFSLTGATAPYPELRADILAGASFVSVELGDYAEIDAETVFLEVFNASGALLDSVSEDVPADRMVMTTLSLSVPGISYAIFGARNSTLDNGSSVPADNFTFTPSATSIPVPGAIVLGLIGTGLIDQLRRREIL
jgi:hypothetical protein